MVSSVGTGRRVRVKKQSQMVDRLECRDRPPRPGRQKVRQISTELGFFDRYRCRGLASEGRSRPDFGPGVGSTSMSICTFVSRLPQAQ